MCDDDAVMRALVFCLLAGACDDAPAYVGWRVPQALSEPDVPCGEPAVATDADGHVFVAFMEHVEGAPGPYVRLLVSDDAGEMFRSVMTYESTATTRTHFAGDVTVAASDDGDAYFAFIDYRYDGSQSQIMLASSHDHGAAWSEPSSVPGTETPAFEDRPWLTVDQTNGHVALGVIELSSATSGREVARRSQDRGATWSEAATVGLGSINTTTGLVSGIFAYTSPAISASGETLYAAHVGDATTGAQTVDLLHGSTTFSKQTLAPIAVIQRIFPLVAAGPAGVCGLTSTSKVAGYSRAVRGMGSSSDPRSGSTMLRTQSS